MSCSVKPRADVGEALLRMARAKIALHSTGQVRAMLERSARCLANGLDANHPLTLAAQATFAQLPT